MAVRKGGKTPASRKRRKLSSRAHASLRSPEDIEIARLLKRVDQLRAKKEARLAGKKLLPKKTAKKTVKKVAKKTTKKAAKKTAKKAAKKTAKKIAASKKIVKKTEPSKKKVAKSKKAFTGPKRKIAKKKLTADQRARSQRAKAAWQRKKLEAEKRRIAHLRGWLKRKAPGYVSPKMKIECQYRLEQFLSTLDSNVPHHLIKRIYEKWYAAKIAIRDKFSKKDWDEFFHDVGKRAGLPEQGKFSIFSFGES